ncbi:MAG: GtrA family protein [Paludibacteraceae bacterium]
MNKLLQIINKLWQYIPLCWREMIRFGIVGVVATVIHYGVYLLLNMWLWTWLAYTIGYVLSFCVNYLLTNYFTFRTKPNVKNGAGFALSHIINYTLHILLLELFLRLGISDAWAPIPVYAIVIPVNFLILRRFFH